VGDDWQEYITHVAEHDDLPGQNRSAYGEPPRRRRGMTEPSPAVVAEGEAFLARHAATATSVKPSGLGEIVDDATLAELRTCQNGTKPTE
jgi:hypothetical protein